MNTRAKLIWGLFFDDPKSGKKSIQNPSRWPTDDEINAVLPFCAVIGTPVNAVAATAILTATSNATAGKKVTIGDIEYTFVAALSDPAVAYEVLIGVSASATLDNLIAAINGAAGEGTTYGTGTEAHPDVTAAAGAGDTMDVTAKVKGVIGNAIAKVEDDASLDWDGTGAVLTGGVNGTVGIAGEIRMDASYIYSLVVDNTIADANWERTARSSY